MIHCSKCLRATEANDEQRTYFKHELGNKVLGGRTKNHPAYILDPRQV